MAQKQEIDIGLSIYNKENTDLTYTIVDKKEKRFSGGGEGLKETKRNFRGKFFLFLGHCVVGSGGPIHALFSLPSQARARSHAAAGARSRVRGGSCCARGGLGQASPS